MPAIINTRRDLMNALHQQDLQYQGERLHTPEAKQMREICWCVNALMEKALAPLIEQYQQGLIDTFSFYQGLEAFYTNECFT